MSEGRTDAFQLHSSAPRSDFSDFRRRNRRFPLGCRSIHKLEFEFGPRPSPIYELEAGRFGTEFAPLEIGRTCLTAL